MKNRVLFLVFCLSAFLTTALQAQNKTLGVGATTPNQNAALHVESPTNNQGFIMPRLTTAQRIAMILGSDDIGLLVYDRDLQEVVSWNGTAWADAGTFLSSDTTATLHVVNNGTIAGSDVAGSAAILAETTNAFSAITGRIPASASGANAISGITQSTNPGSWAGYFDALTGTAVWGTTNSDVGGALAPVGVYGESRGTGSVGGAFWIQNAANNYPALYSNTIGTGPSLSVNITNAASTAPALTAQTDGTGASAHFHTATGWTAIHAENNGTGTGVFARSTGTGVAISGETSTGWATIHGNNLGTAGHAGYFAVDNTASTSAALAANTNGTSYAVSGHTTGTGTAGQFTIDNGANSAPAVNATTNGTGAAFFGSTASGYTVFAGQHNGATNGFAGLFEVTNAANTYQALRASSAGTGGAALFETTNASASAPNVQSITNAPGGAIRGTSTGTGYAGWFDINNTGSSANALWASTNGTGTALNAQHTGAGGDAIFAEKTGTNGGAGNFIISNGSNTTSALHGSTAATGGLGIAASNSANGVAFAIMTGGMRVTTVGLTGGGQITQRAVAYHIDANSYTFDNVAVPFNEGDIFYFFNTDVSSGSVNGIQVSPAPAPGKTLIYLGGALREF